MSKAGWGLGAAAAVVVIAVGGWWWAQKQGQAELRTAATQIRQSLGPRGSFTYDETDVHPLSGSADLSHVAIRFQSGELLTADKVSVSPGAAPGKLSWLRATGLKATNEAGQGFVTATMLDATDILLPPSDPGQTFDVAAAVIGRASLGKVAVHGAGGSATADAVLLKAYGAGQASSVEIRSFVLPVANSAQVDRVVLARANASGVDLASTVNALEHHVRAPTPSRPFTMEVDGFSATLQNAPVAIVTRAELTGAPSVEGSRAGSRFRVDHFTFRPTDEKTRNGFRSLGLDDIEGSVQATGTYSVAGGVFMLEDDLILDRIGHLGFALDLDHLDLSGLARRKVQPSDVYALLANAELASATLRLTDAGLLDRIAKVEASKTGLQPEAVRAALAAKIAQNPLFAMMPQGVQMATALQTFIGHGGALTVAARPPAPVGVLPLALSARTNPMGVATQLGLSVTASASNAAGSPPSSTL